MLVWLFYYIFVHWSGTQPIKAQWTGASIIIFIYILYSRGGMFKASQSHRSGKIIVRCSKATIVADAYKHLTMILVKEGVFPALPPLAPPLLVALYDTQGYEGRILNPRPQGLEKDTTTSLQKKVLETNDAV